MTPTTYGQVEILEFPNSSRILLESFPVVVAVPGVSSRALSAKPIQVFDPKFSKATSLLTEAPIAGRTVVRTRRVFRVEIGFEPAEIEALFQNDGALGVEWPDKSLMDSVPQLLIPPIEVPDPILERIQLTGTRPFVLTEPDMESPFR